MFLSYNDSHLSTGRCHVGGVLLKGVAINSKSQTTLQSLLEKVLLKANTEVEANYMTVKGCMKIVYVNNRSSTSTNKIGRQEAIVRCAHTALGPQMDDEEKFLTRL